MKTDYYTISNNISTTFMCYFQQKLKYINKNVILNHKYTDKLKDIKKTKGNQNKK